MTLRLLVTACFVLLAAPAFALPVLSIGNATRSDATITMTLTLSDASNAGITAIKSDIKFASGIFEPSPGSTSSMTGKSIEQSYSQDGILTVTIYGGVNTLADGEIAKLRFTLTPQTNPSDSQVKIVNQSATNAQSNKLGIDAGLPYSVPQSLLTADLTPNTFSFTSQTNVARGVMVQSAPVTVSGINGAAPITISNGEFSIDGGTTWSAVESTVTNGQQVIAKHTTSSAFATTTTTILSINGISAAFTSTTANRAIGDITGNGMAPALSDALLILQAVVGINKLTAEQQHYADMNSDGRVDVGDALLILAKVVGL